MLRVLGAALGNSTIVAVLLGLGAVLYHGWRTGQLQDLVQASDRRLGALMAERDHWRDQALAQSQRAAQLEALRKAANQAVRQLQGELAQRRQHYAELATRIAEQPPEEDGPVAPVLREALEGLP